MARDASSAKSRESSRLVAKGALQYEQVGNSHLYQPACSRERLARRELHRFVDRVLDGAGASAILHLIEETELDDQEVDRLRQLLEKKQKQSRGGAGQAPRKGGTRDDKD